MGVVVCYTFLNSVVYGASGRLYSCSAEQLSTFRVRDRDTYYVKDVSLGIDKLKLLRSIEFLRSFFEEQSKFGSLDLIEFTYNEPLEFEDMRFFGDSYGLSVVFPSNLIEDGENILVECLIDNFAFAADYRGGIGGKVYVNFEERVEFEDMFWKKLQFSLATAYVGKEVVPFLYSLRPPYLLEVYRVVSLIGHAICFFRSFHELVLFAASIVHIYVSVKQDSARVDVVLNPLRTKELYNIACPYLDSLLSVSGVEHLLSISEDGEGKIIVSLDFPDGYEENGEAKDYG